MSSAAAYVRVSKTDQVEGFSLETQERIVREYCARQGWGEPTIYREEGRSAFTERAERRPQFMRLLEDAELRRFSHVVVYQFDRWSRWASVALTAHDRLKRARVRLVSVTEPFDPDTAFGKLQYTQMSGQAEYYSSALSERLLRVFEVKRAKGHKMGPTHYGGRINPETRAEELDPDRAAHLRRFLEVAAEHSQIDTCEILNTEGVPARWGGPWHPSTVSAVIRGGSWLLSQPAPWPDLYRAAAQRRPAPPIHRTAQRRLLTGLIRCACGGSIAYRRKPDGRAHLVCLNWERPRGSGCPQGRRTIASHYDAIATAVFMALPNLAESDILPADEAATAAITELKARKRRLGIRLETDNIEELEYREKVAALDGEIAAVQSRAIGERVVVLTGIGVLQEAWRRGLMTVPERNRVLRLVFARVVIDGTAARVHLLPDVAAALERHGWSHHAVG